MRPRLLIGTAAFGLALGLVAPAVPAPAYPDAPKVTAPDGACEGELVRLTNQARAATGLPALREDPAVDQVARSWTARMAASGTLAHNPTYNSAIRQQVPTLRRSAENVGRGQSAGSVHQAFMGSAGHRANILDASVQRLAVGCVREGTGRVWVTVNFVGAGATIPDRRPAPFRSAGDASARLRWWLLAAGPGAAQLEHDGGRLLTDWSAADLAVYLATSSAHANLVPGAVRLYGAAFDRLPDASGLVYWVQQRQQGMALAPMAQRFVASAEFQTLYGQLGNRAYATQVYRNVLRREPDRSGLDYWTARLDAGATRGQVLVGFSESPEYKTATAASVTVSWAFAQMIGRMPSASERTLWEGRLASGGTVEALVRFLAASDAFSRRVATGAY